MGTKNRIGLAALGAFAIAGLDFLFDWIGRSTAPEDWVVFVQRLGAIVNVLNAIPWLWPVVGVVLLTAWAFWPKPKPTPAQAPHAIIIEPPKAKVGHSPLDTDHVPERGYYHQCAFWIESPFAVNAIRIEVETSPNDLIDVTALMRSGSMETRHEQDASKWTVRLYHPRSSYDYNLLINTKSEAKPKVQFSVE